MYPRMLVATRPDFDSESRCAKKGMILVLCSLPPPVTFFWYKVKGVGLHVPQAWFSYNCHNAILTLLRRLVILCLC